MGPAQRGRECPGTFCRGILYGTWSEWRFQVRTSAKHFYPSVLCRYLFPTIGPLSRTVSENKCTCTRSRCSYSGIPQRVWVSRTRTCELPSFPASTLPLLAPSIRSPPSPQYSTTSAMESSRGTKRNARRTLLVGAGKAIAGDVVQPCQTEKSSRLSVRQQLGSQRQTRLRSTTRPLRLQLTSVPLLQPPPSRSQI